MENWDIRRYGGVKREMGRDLSNRNNQPSLGETVYRSLCEALRDGTYRSGDRLREEEVAQRLNVSRTPVREALNRLLSKGLLEPAGGRGLVVRSLSRNEIIELYAMREILEGAAAALAAQYASPIEIDALHELENRFAETGNGPTELARINRLFHEAIFSAAKNRYLNNALQELQNTIAMLGETTLSVADRPEAAVREHAEILAAIMAHDPERAEQTARSHIREALKTRLKLGND